MKRRAVLFVLLAAAVVLAVWRVGAPSSGKAAGGPSGSLSFEEDGSSTDAAQSIPAVTEMSVFTKPRTESDVLPSEYSFRLRSMSCNDWLRAHDGCFGDDIAGQSHLLLAGLGETNASLYAWPMSSGGVCWAWGEGSGLCAQHFPAEDRAAVTGIDPDAMGAGAPGTIVGVVPTTSWLLASVCMESTTTPSSRTTASSTSWRTRRHLPGGRLGHDLIPGRQLGHDPG